MAMTFGREPVWSRTPPAIAPACLGLLGCGLGWRRAAEALGAPSGVGELWIGASVAVFLACLALYGLKVATRPGALAFDLRMPAGRGAVPAFTLGLLLAAAGLATVWPAVATLLWGAGVIGHVALAALLLRELSAGPPEARPATASLLVPFAGQMAAPLAGAQLGFPGISSALLLSGIAVWLAIAPFALRRLWRAAPPPPPMRPATFILVAPPALAATGFEALDPGGAVAPWLFAIAVLTLAGLLVRLPWLVEGGWTPGWGAFAFPAAAFANAALAMAAVRVGGWWDGAAALALTLASLLCLWIAWRTAEAWAKGRLAQR